MQIKEIHALQQNWFLQGKTRSLRSRREVLLSLRSLLKANEERIASAVYADFGKSAFRVRENELGLVYAEIRRMCRHMRKWSQPHRPGTSLVNLPGTSRVYAVPYGNTLIIGPWNYPVQLALIPVVSAIAAGNTVILKPSEISAHTSGLLASLINENLPSEVIHVEEGGVGETSALLKMKFNKIFFTGSSPVGKIVMKAAAEHLTPVTLELGGKNPAVVMPDCHLRMAARRIAWGKFHNGGQACVAVDHVYVHEDIFEAFQAEVSKETDRLFSAGDARQIMPGIINRKHFDRVMDMITPEKVIRGGGGDADALFIEPTIISEVEESDPVMAGEVFGPVLPLLRFADLDALLAKLESRPSPLAFYFFSSDGRLSRRIQQRFRSGGGMINDTVLHFINGTTPFGGVGESGMGSYHGRAGFEAFTHRKTVLKKPTWFELWVKHPPYTRFKLKIIKAILR